jgi:hypothetical protein
MVEEVSKVKKYNGRPVKVDLVNYLVGKVKYTKGALWQMSVDRLIRLKMKVIKLRGELNEQRN